MSEVPLVFDELAREHSPMLYRYAYWLAGNKADAEDLVQETLLRAWKNLSSLREAGAVKGWLIIILRRENARRFSRKQHPIVDVPLEILADPDSESDRDEQVIELRKAIGNLAENYREPLAMQIILGMTLDEIGEAMDLPQNTVATRCARARKQLMEFFEQQANITEGASR